MECDRDETHNAEAKFMKNFFPHCIFVNRMIISCLMPNLALQQYLACPYVQALHLQHSIVKE